MSTAYTPEELTRTAVDALAGSTVLDFGTNWCGYCQTAEPIVDAAFVAHRSLRHVKIEDGKGRALGRSFGVKLWPTLVFLANGREVARIVRPTDAETVRHALEQLEQAG